MGFLIVKKKNEGVKKAFDLFSSEDQAFTHMLICRDPDPKKEICYLVPSDAERTILGKPLARVYDLSKQDDISAVLSERAYRLSNGGVYVDIGDTEYHEPFPKEMEASLGVLVAPHRDKIGGGFALSDSNRFESNPLACPAESTFPYQQLAAIAKCFEGPQGEAFVEAKAGRHNTRIARSWANWLAASGLFDPVLREYGELPGAWGAYGMPSDFSHDLAFLPNRDGDYFVGPASDDYFTSQQQPVRRKLGEYDRNQDSDVAAVYEHFSGTGGVLPKKIEYWRDTTDHRRYWISPDEADPICWDVSIHKEAHLRKSVFEMSKDGSGHPLSRVLTKNLPSWGSFSPTLPRTNVSIAQAAVKEREASERANDGEPGRKRPAVEDQDGSKRAEDRGKRQRMTPRQPGHAYTGSVR